MDDLDSLIIENEEENEINEENEVVVPVKKLKKKHWCIPNQAQLDGMKKGRAIRDENSRIRKEKREIQAEEYAKIYQERVLQKALAIRRRQIKQEYMLNQIPDDNTTEEELRKMKKQILKPPPPPEPEHQFVFV